MQPTNTQPTAPTSNTPFNNGAPLTTQQIQNMRQQMNISPTAGNSSAGSSNISSQWAKFDGAQQQQSTQSAPLDNNPDDHLDANGQFQPYGTIASRTGADINQAGSNINDAIQGTGNYAGQNGLQRGLGAASEAATGLTNTVADLVPGGVGKEILGNVGKVMQGGINNVGDVLGTLGSMLGSTKAAQDIVNRFPGLSDALINAGQATATAGAQAGNISGTILGAEGVAGAGDKALSAAGDAVKGTANEASNIASDVKNSSPVQSIKDKATQMAQNAEADAWKRPSTKATGYNKAADIYKNAEAQGNDISQKLANSGVKISDHVETTSTGRKVFDTSDTADKIRADAMKTSNEMLRPALEKADASGEVPKTPVKDLINEAKNNIQNDKSVPEENKQALISKINRAQQALQSAHPDGLSLTDLHNEKIVRDLNSKYSPVGDIGTNMEAVKNKAIGDAARGMVEDKAPEGIPVKEFNKALSEQHQMANYLDALHGKSVPQSLLSKVSKWTAKVAGAGVGGSLGGGVMGDLAGYHLGGVVESMLENIPAKVRGSLLDNLKESNPEAFDKVKAYLDNNASDQTPNAQAATTKNSGGNSASKSNTDMTANVLNKNQSISDNTTTSEPKSQVGKAVKSTINRIKETPGKNGGYVSIGGKSVNIHPEDLGEMKDFTDYAAGDYKPSESEAHALELSASRISEKYGIKSFKTTKGLANEFGRILDTNTKK